ncbi:glycosyltransferase [Breznakibacter xylanolyticus]|nr:glycosyltransferase [Breznakibacter xylanolyticus]
MKKGKTSLIGPFSPPYNGDGVKNDFLKAGFGEMLSQPFECVDTIYRGQGRMRFVAHLVAVLWRSNQIILSLNKWGRMVIIPLCCLMSVLRKKKVVLFVIGGSYDLQLKGLNLLARSVYVLLLNGLNGVLGESYRLVDGLRKIGVRHASVIYNPRIDSGHRWSLTEDSRNKIVFVSRVTPSKGIFELMDAIALLCGLRKRDYQLHIFGPIDPECEREFFKRVELHPTWYLYRGVVQPQQVQEVISRFHLLALPTFHYGEGLPGVLVEAGFAGMPMVMTRFNSLDEYFKENESAGFVECHDVDALAGKLDDVLLSDSLATHIGKGAQEVTAPFHLQRVMNDVRIFLLSKGWVFDAF